MLELLAQGHTQKEIAEQLFLSPHTVETHLRHIYAKLHVRNGIAAVSTDRIIQRGDLLMIDWGVGLMNFHTDMKRIAYVLRQGETAPPAGIQNAFDQGLKVRDVIRRTIMPGRTAA